MSDEDVVTTGVVVDGCCSVDLAVRAVTGPDGDPSAEPPPVGHGQGLLTPAEVATIFGVDPKTVCRWAAKGLLSSIRTPGGHYRFRESEVRSFFQ